MRNYYHVIEESGYENIGSHGYFETHDEAKKQVERLQDFFPNSFFYVYSSNSKKEPEFITI